MEVGFLFRNYLTVSNTASQAARAASVAGNDANADFLILQTAKHAVAAMGDDNLLTVVVFEATGPGSVVPNACLPSGVATSGISQPGVCNVYTAAEFERELNLIDASMQIIRDANGDPIPSDWFGCTDVASGALQNSIDTAWCPFDRVVALSGAGSGGVGPDYVGIYVAARHDFLTGFIGTTQTVAATRIIRIEPERN